MRRRLLLGLLVGWSTLASASEEGERGPTRSGLPGLSQTITAPIPGSAALRVGLFWENATIDPAHGFELNADPFGSTTQSRQLRFLVGMHASRFLFLSGSLPVRWVDRAGVTVVEDDVSTVLGDADATGLGDAEVGLTGQIYRNSRITVGGWGLARLPTGDESRGLSTGNVDGEVGLHLVARFLENSVAPAARVHFNLGMRINKNEAEGYGVLQETTQSPEDTGVYAPVYPPSPAGEQRDNDEFLLRLAVEFQRRWARLYVEGAWDWLAWSDLASGQEGAAWLTPGVDLGPTHGPRLKAAWAILLSADDAETEYVPALPDWAFQAAVTWPIFLGGRDTDGDLVPDDEDPCPDVPEDIDGFEDEDGCPDDDNDGDGIPDRRDRAPNLAEDFDGFEDTDGRPDLDNDLDGIADVDDACPNRPEDFDGFEDEDGCPDVVVDADGDGILDARDECPQEAEDRDGFEDADGCPDPDNDLDGIPDAEDACPNEAEDYDGVDDDDGCPDDA